MNSKHRLIMQLHMCSNGSLPEIVSGIRSLYGEETIPELSEEEAKQASFIYGYSWTTIFNGFKMSRGHIGSSFDDFLIEEGIFEKTTLAVLERIKASGERYVKRNNWTTEEVISILKGCRIYGDEESRNVCNMALDDAIEEFSLFAIPENDSEALGYCPEEDVVYCIGSSPSLNRNEDEDEEDITLFNEASEDLSEDLSEGTYEGDINREI